MGVSVAEYYVQITDFDTPIIQPVKGNGICPFSSGNTCKKLRSGNPPVCSVRKADGTMWIVCSDRLCNTKKIYLYAAINKRYCLILHIIYSVMM